MGENRTGGEDNIEEVNATILARFFPVRHYANFVPSAGNLKTVPRPRLGPLAFLIRAQVFRYNKASKGRSGSSVDGTHRLYLRLGDKVTHLNYGQWGGGVVVEEMTSILAGGTCLVRILFADGQQRTFNNDLDSETCCYYFGVRRHQHPLFDVRRARASRSAK